MSICNILSYIVVEKQGAKKRRAGKSGPFDNLHQLRIILDATKKSVESLFETDSFLPQNPTILPANEATNPLRNIIVLSHDIAEGTTGLQDWTEIVLTSPSGLKALQKASLLWNTGEVQLEIDYSKGYWEGNR